MEFKEIWDAAKKIQKLVDIGTEWNLKAGQQIDETIAEMLI